MQGLGVEIVGVGAAGFKPRILEASTRELMFEAASLAYVDAGVDPRAEVDSFVTTAEDLWEGWSITDEMVPDQLGGAQRPVCTIPGDAVTALGNAAMQIRSGLAEVVAVEAHSKVSDVLDKEAVETMAQEPSLVRPLGMESDTLAALEMDAFLAASGMSMQDCDLVIDNAMKRGKKNPLAPFASRAGKRMGGVISAPLRRVDKAPYSEGAVVVVLASRGWARRRRSVQPVRVDGVAWTSSMSWLDGEDVLSPGYARDSMARAAGQAGLRGGGGSVDVIEADDTYSFKLIQHLASICDGVQAARAILEGEGPVLNPSGGSLAVGNLIEASAMHRLYEAVIQLRGEAGRRQVEGASTALVQSWRGVPTSTGGVALLSVEP